MCASPSPDDSAPPRIALYCENGVFAVAALFALWKVGAVAVPLAGDLSGNRLRAAIEHSGAVAMVVSHRKADAARRLVDAAGKPELIVEGENRFPAEPRVQTGEAVRWIRSIGPDSMAAIIYTSGSLAEPKGVMLSHSNLAENAGSVIESLQLSGSDRVLLTLPYSYVFGLSVVLTHIMAGASIVMERGMVFPGTALQTLQKQACTGFVGVPSSYVLICNHSDVRNMAFPELRYVAQAGGPLSRELAATILECFPEASLYAMYGATEAGPRISCVCLNDEPGCIGTVGRPIRGVEVCIRIEGSMTTNTGIEGEIAVRSPGIMLGYWRRPDLTARALHDGWLLTGDIGLLDRNGCIVVSGRASAFLKVRGHRVSLNEIEQSVRSLPGVEDALVIGRPDDRDGEVPIAFVVGHAVPEECRRAVASELPSYMRPVEYRMLDAIPRTANGKPNRRLLQETLS